MELDRNKFALAAAVTVGLISLLCAALVAVAPELMVQLAGWLMHLVNLEAAQVTFQTALFGFIQAFIYTYIGAWIFAWLHNKFVKKA